MLKIFTTLYPAIKALLSNKPDIKSIYNISNSENSDIRYIIKVLELFEKPTIKV